jgi:hypothetical protein
MAALKTGGRREPLLLRFAVLVPHRDIRPALNTYRRRLFVAGIRGAYSFPPAAPLALLTRPLCERELKELAVSLRTLSLESGNGFFAASTGGVLPLTAGGFSFWALPLSVPMPPLPDMPGIIPFPSPALCAALADTKTEEVLPRDAGSPPELRFRAAAVANLTIRFFTDSVGGAGEKALPGLSCRWVIGKPCWLPPPAKH